MTPHADFSVVQSQATEIARGWSTPGAPQSWALTAAIFDTLARDEQLLTVAADIPSERLPALLFCAAACYLIHEEGSGLARYFPIVGQPQPAIDAAFAPDFRAFCLAHRFDLLDVCSRRRYQMNEVARSTQVALALGVVGAGSPSTGIAFIDLGTGAGLGLHLDRYHHRLSGGRRLGDRASSVVLDCETAGPFPPIDPCTLPPIGWRVGIDLDPLDLGDSGDRRWAASCLPADSASLERFERATQLALAHPCPIIGGDALDVLPAVLDSVPDHLLPVVVDTYTAVFFSDDERSALRGLLRERGAVGDLVWISLDPLVPLGAPGRHSVQDLDVPRSLATAHRQHGVFALLGVLAFREGRPRGRLLARAHPSGTSMTWLDEAGE